MLPLAAEHELKLREASKKASTDCKSVMQTNHKKDRKNSSLLLEEKNESLKQSKCRNGVCAVQGLLSFVKQTSKTHLFNVELGKTTICATGFYLDSVFSPAAEFKTG